MHDPLHLQDIIQYAPLLLQGLGTTLILSLAVIAMALVFGMGIAIVRFYGVPGVSPLFNGYVYILRSIPVVMLLALVHYGLLPAIGFQQSFFVSALVALSLSTTAYVAEIFRGGFHAIHTEEHEAAISLGFSVVQRLLYVLIPLVVSRIKPALINQFVTLIKDTSLASIIGVIELTRSAEIVYEQTLHEVTLLTLISLIYFALCYGLSLWGRRMDTHAPDDQIDLWSYAEA